MSAGRRRAVLWCGGTTVVWLAFLVYAARNLDNFRPVSNDEVWIMSASHKLATEGVLGSDLFAGLFQGERHYYFNLPAHHYVQAIVFRLWGSGIAEARWPSLAAATVVVWVTGWLAFRWYGLAAAWLTTVLLVAWRVDLVGLYPGLPLLGVARSGRYDLAAVAWIWVAIALLDRLVRHPRRLTALGVGLSAGAAALTQFFGVFVVPVILIVLGMTRVERSTRVALLGWISLGFAIVVLPYAVDVARHPAEWIGQNFTIRRADRVRIDSIAFYVENVWREPNRFMLLASGPSSILLAAGIWPALAWLVARARSPDLSGDRLLLTGVIVLAGSLALVDATKAALYAIVLWPSLCLVVGAALVGAVRWGAGRDRRPLVRVGAVTLAGGFLAIVLSDGLRAYRIDAQESSAASRYLEVGARIKGALPERTVVLGPNRWWWPLSNHEYRSMSSLWWQWQVARSQGSAEPELIDWIDRIGARYLVVTDNLRVDLRRFPEPLQRQFQALLDESCTRVAAWHDSTYGSIEIYLRSKP